MSEAPTDQKPTLNRKRLIWILVILLAVILVGVIVFVFAARGPGPAPTPSPTETSVTSPTPTPTPTVTPTTSPTPTASPTPTPPGPDPRAANFADALTSGNTAALEQELANPIRVSRAATDCCGSVEPVDAILLLAYVNPGSGASWNFAVDEETLANLRSVDYYGQFFPPEAVVGLSSDGYLVSFIPATAGGAIETLFMAMPSVVLE